MSWVILIVIGLFCGFIDTTLGMGYGVTIASILITVGYAPAIVSASIHTSEAVVDTVSAYSHHKLDNVERGLLPIILLPGMLSAIIGAFFLSWLALGSSKWLVRFILIGMGLIILYKHIPKDIVMSKKLSKRQTAILAFFAGFLDVTGGGGWGPIMTPSLIINGTEPRKAIGTVEFTEPLISAAAVIVFLITLGSHMFLWNITIPLIIGGIILAPIGARLTKRIPRRALGILIGLWLIGLNVWGLLA